MVIFHGRIRKNHFWESMSAFRGGCTGIHFLVKASFFYLPRMPMDFINGNHWKSEDSQGPSKMPTLNDDI